MIKLTFLSADRPLTKSYTQTPEGLTKEPYPRVWEFTSRTQEVTGLPDLARAIRLAGSRGECLLKGNVERDLVQESRAGSTNPNALTKWACMDVDRLAPQVTLSQLLGLLGLGGVSYVVQYSSSYMIEPERGLTCHVFLELREPQAPAVLKAWLHNLNLTIDVLNKDLRLTRTGNALSFPLDVTTCQNDKLIYIAPPVLDGLEDPVATRVQYVAGEVDTFELPIIPPEVTLRQNIDARINELREADGLPARKYVFVADKQTGLEVMNKPDKARLTGMKAERGFVYFNLNGGDSWGYFHPEGQPDIIRNFKGEPNYRTVELLPEYWAQVQQDKKKIQKEIKDTGFVDSRILVFRDFKSGLYYNGTWDGDRLQLAVAKSETQIQHYLMANGLPEIDWIPIWQVRFDPQSDIRVDFANKLINLFEPTKLMKSGGTPGEFPVIKRVLESAVSRDPATLDHFLNWLACVWHFRDRTLTAWVLHGIEGTGKGILANHILAPIFGRQHVIIKRMAELEDQFNGDLEQALFMIVDEAQINDSKQSKMIMANLKNQITEPTTNVRKMRTAAYAVMNHSNWLFFSNMPDPVVISGSDRRFNVGEFRREKLVLTDEEIGAIADELPAFANHLEMYNVDPSRARTVLQTDERTDIMQASSTSLELVADALRAGKIEMFWEDMPNGDMSLLPPYQQMLVEQYVDLVHRMVRGEASRLTRDELRVLFQYLCGDMPSTPTKFTQLLRHRGVHLKNMQINGRVCRGLQVDWHINEAWRDARLAEISPTKKIRSVA